MSIGLKGIENGRAEFAYKCAEQNLTLSEFTISGVTIKNEILKKNYNQKVKEKDDPKDDENKKKAKRDYNATVDSFLNTPKEKYKEFSSEKNPNKVISHYNKYGKEYKSLVKKIPMLIKTNGMGAAFAFVFSKSKDGNVHELVYYHTNEWLKYKNLINEDIIKNIIEKNSSEYRRITIETLALFNWLKRFADGLIEGDEDNA